MNKFFYRQSYSKSNFKVHKMFNFLSNSASLQNVCFQQIFKYSTYFRAESEKSCTLGKTFFYIQYSSGNDPFQYFYIIKNLKTGAIWHLQKSLSQKGIGILFIQNGRDRPMTRKNDSIIRKCQQLRFNAI